MISVGQLPPVVMSPADAPPNARQRRLLGITVVLLVGWSVALALMDVLTADQEILSVDQVRQSELVVVGRLAATGADRIVVERVLRGTAKADAQLTVLNLREVTVYPYVNTGLGPGQAYIFPLSPFRQDYVVTVLDEKLTTAGPLIYRGTDAMIAKAKSALE